MLLSLSTTFLTQIYKFFILFGFSPKKLLLVKLRVVVSHKFVLNQNLLPAALTQLCSPLTLSLGFQTLTNVFPACGGWGHTLSFKSTCF